MGPKATKALRARSIGTLKQPSMGKDATLCLLLNARLTLITNIGFEVGIAGLLVLAFPLGHFVGASADSAFYYDGRHAPLGRGPGTRR